MTERKMYACDFNPDLSVVRNMFAKAREAPAAE